MDLTTREWSGSYSVVCYGGEFHMFLLSSAAPSSWHLPAMDVTGSAINWHYLRGGDFVLSLEPLAKLKLRYEKAKESDIIGFILNSPKN